MVEVKVPEFGDSILEVQISKWLKQVGEWVEKDDDLVEIETEKASTPLAAEESGVLESISFEDGAFVKVGEVIAKLDPSQQPAAVSASANGSASAEASDDEAGFVMPAARRLLEENNLSENDVKATGPNGRLLKEDVINHLENKKSAKAAPAKSSPAPAAPSPSMPLGDRSEERKPMSMIRRTIAKRLVEAQQTAAMLTTFNEIDMKPVMELRSQYKERFLEKHGVKLGFMSFFAKASVEALKTFPAINASIDGTDVIYRNYCDVGVAIGGGKGLVVPVLRSVEKLSFAEIEMQIGNYAKLAKDNRVMPADLQGGTFTISNGGVYGSLLSTPILNPPQSGILGLHTIQERPVAISGNIEIRPMMYVALSYDHRIVDGKEAVGFLKTIKEVMEEPARLFLEI